MAWPESPSIQELPNISPPSQTGKNFSSQKSMTEKESRKSFDTVDEEIYPSLSSAADATLKSKEDSVLIDYTSPKKKAKISVQVLQSRNWSSEVASSIGDVVHRPNTTEGVVQKGVVKVDNLRCTIVENRLGRIGSNVEKRSGMRFIYVADYTGFLSIGMDAEETGLSHYDIEEGKCEESTRCVFNASISGSVAWRASRSSSDIPMFFLNNGSIERLEVVTWDSSVWKFFPSTDVLREIVHSKFATSSLFGTTGVCGRVDEICENQKEMTLSLEDPVGYIAVCVEIENSSSEEIFNAKEAFTVGKYLFIGGSMRVKAFKSTENAIVYSELSKIALREVGKEQHQLYVAMMAGTSKLHFQGIKPESM